MGTTGSLPNVNWPRARRVPVIIHEEQAAWRRASAHHFDAVVPPQIAAIELSLPSSLHTAVVAAERALVALDTELGATDRAVVEAVTLSLLRSESVSSSRIEGIEISNRRLAEAIHDPARANALAKEVVGNVAAMRAAVEIGAAAEPFTATDLLELHRLLMVNVPALKEGEWRTKQNWIGTADLPDGVEYVPPPLEMIPQLIDDLCDYINTSNSSAVLRAAIAHAQFEAIHPFVDGNGRVGRCLVSVALRKAGGTNTIPPVSGVLLTDTAGYFAALREYQQDANPGPWITLFSTATVAACGRVRDLTDSIRTLRTSWKERMGSPRAGTFVDRLIDQLPAMPLTDADQVAERLVVDPNVARRGLNALEEAGIVKQSAAGKRNRVWRADEMLQLLDEQSLGRTRPPTT